MEDKLINKSEVCHKIRKTKKPTKCYDLIDFVVIKKKSTKNNKLVNKRISSRSIKLIKKGKLKNKKPTTLKKKILRARTEKKKAGDDDDVLLKGVTNEIEKLNITEIPNNCSQENQQAAVHHSRNFREYCDHFATQDIKQYSEIVIKDLLRYQENKFQQNPVKAKANRRYVVGFKEVKKFLFVEKLKLIFIAPDLEKNSEVDKLVNEIKDLADKHKTPIIFGIKRRKLGYLLLKKVPVSIVGIFDYQGTTENVNILLSNVLQEKILYKSKMH